MRYQEHTIFFHYTSTITPFVYISAAYGMSRLAQSRRATLIMCVLPLFLSIFANGIYGPMSQYRYYFLQLNRDREDMYKGKMLNEIPGNAAVVSSFEFSPMLAARPYFYSFHYIYAGYFSANVPYRTPNNIDYALINFNDHRLLSFQNHGSDIHMREFFDNNRFGVVDMVNNVVLFKKGYQGSLKLYEIHPATNASGTTGTGVQISNQINLSAFDIDQGHKDDQLFLNFVFHWKALGPMDQDIHAMMVVVNAEGRVVYFKKRDLCYGIYPTFRWSPKQEVIEYYHMLVPSPLAVGEYKVYMVLFPVGQAVGTDLNKIGGNKLVGGVHPYTILTSFLIK